MMYVLFLLAGFSLAGCATVEGIGKDVESAGEAVQDAADGD
ncbi:entericidin A/B family lipoprotein [Fluctibacter corallii]